MKKSITKTNGNVILSVASMGIVSATSACVSSVGTNPEVQKQGRAAWEKAIYERNYQPLPAPRSDHEVGDVMIANKDGDFTPIGLCKNAFKHIDRSPPVDEPAQVQDWANITQNVKFNLDGSLTVGPLPKGLDFNVGGGASKIANYTLNFGEVRSRKLAIPRELADRVILPQKCAGLVKLLESEPLEADLERTVKDALIVVAETITAENATYTFNLNPQAIAVATNALPSAEEARNETVQQCGARLDAGLGGFIAKATSSSANVKLSNCKSGSFSLTSNKPLVIAHRIASLANWSEERAVLSTDKTYSLEEAPQVVWREEDVDSSVKKASKARICEIFRSFDSNSESLRTSCEG